MNSLAGAAQQLTPAERGRMREHVRALASYLTATRMREIAKESKLLGKEGTRATIADLKRLLPDGDKLAALLATALDSQAGQRAALTTIARLGDEAFRSERADPRVGVVFSKARTALLDGDWERVAARLDQLHALGAVDDTGLIRCADFVLAAVVGEPSRLRAALGLSQVVLGARAPSSPLASRPAAAWASGDGLPAGDAPEPEVARAAMSTGAAPLVLQAKASEADPPARTVRETLRRWRLQLMGLPLAPVEEQELRQVVELANETLETFKGRAAAQAPVSTGLGEGDLLAQLVLVSDALQVAVVDLQAKTAAVVAGQQDVAQRVAAAVERLRRIVGGEDAPGPGAGVAPGRIAELRRQVIDLESDAKDALRTLEMCAEAVPDWPGWSSLPDPADVGLRSAVEVLRRVAVEANASFAEARRRRAEEEEIAQALRDQPGGPSGDAVVEHADGLRFRSARPLPATFPTAPFYAEHLRRADRATRTDAGPAPTFLPLSEHESSVMVTASTALGVQLTVAAANLLRHWAPQCANDHYPPSRLLALVGDARVLCDAGAGTPESDLLARAVVGLALESCADDRTRATARRRRAAILAALTTEAMDAALLESVRRVADRPAMARASAELIRSGFGDLLTGLLLPCAKVDAVAGRALASAVAAAVAGLGAVPFLVGALHKLGVVVAERDAVADYLEDTQRKARVEAPAVTGPPILGDLVRELGARFRERGAGEAQVNVSLARDLAGARVYAPAGASSLEFPLLISSSGQSGAVGVEIVVQRPVRVDSVVVRDFITERHVAWLSGRTLRESASMLVPCRIDVDEERVGAAAELELSVRCNWLGAPAGPPTQLTVPLTQVRDPVRFREIAGVGGQPVDLLEGRTLELSSESVRRCFTTLRDRLTSGRAVRAVVYGRRRRGKSSISLSLSQDAQIRGQWHVVRDQLNATPLSSLATALERLAVLLANGLRAADIAATPPSLTGDNSDRVVIEFQQWLRTVCALAKRPVRVLMLLDEFQRWLSRLTSRDTQALLTILRDFNERSLGHVEVSFVLFGLRNLWDLTGLSNDFRQAVDRWEVKPFTLKEVEEYLGEVVEPKLDGRAQRRLWQLSGGNPYVLNRLGDSLQNYLRRQERGWATILDVEVLVEDVDARDGRLDDFLAYMVREGEDDSAPTLRELTVLRAVAAILHDRRDYDGDTRCDEVEAFLDRRRVRREAGVPGEQLRELAKIGILEERAGERYALPGEWICRQLALMSAELQPVVVRNVSALILNRFREKRTLAHGGQSDVLLVENVVEGGNDVVLKIYRGAADLQATIDREQRLLSRVQHPMVVKCLGAQVDPNRGGVVILQHVAGDSLQCLLDERPPAAASILPGGALAHSVALFVKVADALAECHACGIAHKDLTPANIMVAQRLGEWTPTLIDFGIAGLEGEAEDPLGGTSAMMSPGYTAPEKLKGRRRSQASDIWALGMVILHALTGHSPIVETFRASAAFASDVLTAKLRELLGRMLDEEPSQRPKAPEVRDRLRTVLEPTTWRELSDAAYEAAVEERWSDAVMLAQQAINTVPLDERGSPKHLEHVRLTVRDIMPNVPVSVSWYREVFGHVVDLGGAADLGPGWELLVDQAFHPARTPGERDALLRLALDRLGDAPQSAALAAPIIDLAHRQLPEVAMGSCFDLLADYVARGLVEKQTLVDLCVRAARVVAVRDSGRARVWLGRAERLGGLSTRAADDVARSIGMVNVPGVASAPLPCEQFLGAEVGEGEKGHLAFERIEAFALRLHRRLDFVCGVRRVGRERGNLVARPTLVPLDSTRGVRRSEVTAVNAIYALLDESYTKRDGALRVQILLAATTTAAQREEAFRRLAEEEDLFDVRR